MMKTLEHLWEDYDVNLPAHQVLNGFLALDVQYSEEHVVYLEAGINAFISGSKDSFEGIGNGYEFTCTAEGFEIECQYPDPLTPICIDYATVLKGLSVWRDLCKSMQMSE